MKINFTSILHIRLLRILAETENETESLALFVYFYLVPERKCHLQFTLDNSIEAH